MVDRTGCRANNAIQISDYSTMPDTRCARIGAAIPADAWERKMIKRISEIFDANRLMALAVRVIAQSLQRWITGHSRTITKDLTPQSVPLRYYSNPTKNIDHAPFENQRGQRQFRKTWSPIRRPLQRARIKISRTRDACIPLSS